MKYKHTVGDKTAIIEVSESETTPILIEPDKNKYIQDVKCEYFELRPIIIEKLDIAASLLPKGYKFKIFETYRSVEKQKFFWEMELIKLKQQHPNWPQKKLEEKANEGIANPYKIGSGHQTGAALDLTICKDGKELDMGTSYLDTNNSKTPTLSKGLSEQQIKNRSLLYFLMSVAGLVNYPLEWWHYSYGEQEWAVITNHKKTLFSKIEKGPERQK